MRFILKLFVFFMGYVVLGQVNPNSLMGLPTLPTIAAMNAITTGPAGNVYNLETESIYTFNGTIWIAIDAVNTSFTVNGTNLEITDKGGTLSVPLTTLVDHDWYQANTTDQASTINQSVYTLGNMGVGTNNPIRAVHLAGNNAVMRLSRSTNTAAVIFDRYSGTIDNTWKSFQFGLDATSPGVGDFFFADYNENVAGGGFTRIMSFTDGADPIKFNQYGIGNFDSTTPARFLGVEADGDLVKVAIPSVTVDQSFLWASQVDDTDIHSNGNLDIVQTRADNRWSFTGPNSITYTGSPDHVQINVMAVANNTGNHWAHPHIRVFRNRIAIGEGSGLYMDDSAVYSGRTTTSLTMIDPNPGINPQYTFTTLEDDNRTMNNPTIPDISPISLVGIEKVSVALRN